MDAKSEARFLSIRETAERLSVSPATIYRKVHTGDIPAIRVGDQTGPIRINERELEAWIYSDPRSAA